MGLKEILLEINDETSVINSPTFDIISRDARILPSLDDSDLTFANFDTNSKKVKMIETCVLYIDIRRSTKLNFEHQRPTLVKLYCSFIKGVTKCAEFFGGKVKNIVGDRVMFLFEPEGCCKNAVDAAVLLNTFCTYILNKYFKLNEVSCGIGIDFGKMMAAKAGSVKHGVKKAEHQSIVWLGPPANVASKLADVANKNISRRIVLVGRYNQYGGRFWSDLEIDDFFESLESTYTWPMVARFKYPYGNIWTFFKTLAFRYYPTILMTKKVYDGYRTICSDDSAIRKRLWKPQKISEIESYGIVYGGNVIYIFGKDLHRDKGNQPLFARKK